MSNKHYFSQTIINPITSKLFCILLIFLVSLCWVLPVNAMTQTIKLKSDHGYLIETTFSYDSNRVTTLINEQGLGKSKMIDSMTVSFYKPSGEFISSYNNIIDGVVQGKYFEFNYNPSTQKLLGKIDLGGEVGGEIYLKGFAEHYLSLVEVKKNGVELILDHIDQ